MSKFTKQIVKCSSDDQFIIVKIQTQNKAKINFSKQLYQIYIIKFTIHKNYKLILVINSLLEPTILIQYDKSINKNNLQSHNLYSIFIQICPQGSYTTKISQSKSKIIYNRQNISQNYIILNKNIIMNASRSKLNLESYLTKYAQQTTGDMPFQPSQSRSRKFNQSFEKVTYTQNPQPQSFNPAPSIYCGFNKAQNECIQQLHQIKRSLSNQERQLSFFLENYSKKLYDNLLMEHNRIRQQVLDLLDKSFAESERRIGEIVARENGNQPLEFQSIRKKISQINSRIDELDQMLRGQNYKKAIAQVVTSDFEQQMKNIQVIISEAQKNILDNATKLIIDQKVFNRLRDDIQSLIITDGRKNNFVNNQPSLGNSNVRKNSKSRLGLFQTAPQPKESQSFGGFFNFNNN